jgi:hypothetical protein
MDRVPDILSRYIEAYNGRDLPGMLACLTEDAVFENWSGARSARAARAARPSKGWRDRVFTSSRSGARRSTTASTQATTWR